MHADRSHGRHPAAVAAEAQRPSSHSQLLPAPVLDDTGAYTGHVLPDRTIRVWADLDMRLLMADLNAKLTQPIPS